ncbi:APOBEC1 complementation factor-like isoform X2 [Gigantopelta aegis]|uniref:APOBEC1 complementation factor-like isoform X2 n=1 Tax=Gigantopelta aegis TaxID=1735272 RepID=UPI001B88C8BE|nr:APOBEC1 complementation factor-like isoform X2 [Gigantopelta aegis]
MDKSAPQGVAGAPNEAALLSLMERTGYSMIQQNGQRKYGGPPPVWEGIAPVRGCEIFIGKIPRDCYEDELVPVFEKIGKIYEFRLMMDFSGSNRGYAFCMYTNKQDASRAIKELNNFEIRKGRLLGVCSSVDNCRLFVGGIPKAKQREEILAEMHKVTDGVVDVIVYPSAVDKTKNRGFAFVEYDCHRAAAMARRKLIPGRIQLWGHQIAVDWAEPEQDVDDDTMSTVRILYVRNLMLNTSEETIKEVFEKAVEKEDCIERVKKLRDYAFVHFKTRDDALKAMESLDGSTLEGSTLEVVLAKPVDKNDFSRVLRGNKSAVSEENDAKTVVPQVYGYQYEAPFTTPAFYSQGVQRGAIGIRGILRGRGRGAAGSRGAGGTRGYTTATFAVRDGYKKHPVEILDEMCQKNGWGTPIYQLHSAVHREGAGDMQLFLFKVTIPALASQNPNPFQPNKLCRSVEEAKSYAAEYVLAQLGLPVESAEITATPTSPYQGRPIYPNGAQTFAPALPIVTSASYVVTPGKVVQNPEYPGAYEYQTGYPTSQPPPVYGHQY